MADNPWGNVGIDYHSTNPSFIPSTATDWLGNMVWNPVASMAELVGMSPSPELEKWRMANPGWAMAGELAGMAIPYGGWVKAAGKIPKLAKAIDWAGKLSDNAFLSGALKETVRQAPFEVGRVLASQVVGDKDLGSMAQDGVLNLALGAGLGGVVDGIASAGTRSLPLARLVPGLDVSSPFQLQIRGIKEALSTTGKVLPQNVGAVNSALERLKLNTRLEYLPDKAEKYVGMLEGMESPDQAALVNRLFKPSFGKSGFVKKRFTSAKDDFGSEAAWKTAADAAGLPPEFEELAQFPRQVSFEGKRAQADSTQYGNIIQRNLDSIGDGWFMKREKDDGLFVMAKKVEGKVGTHAPDDKWVVLKTDQPGKFHPPSDKWERGMVNHQAWTPTMMVAKDGGRIFNSVRGFQEKFPYFNYTAKAGDSEGLGALVEKAIPSKLRYGNELGGRFKDFAKEFMTPSRLQFLDNARANHIMTALKEAYDAAEAEGTRIVNGHVAVGDGRSLWHSVMGGYDTVTDSAKDSIRQIIYGLDDKGVSELNHIIRTEAHGDKLQAMLDAGTVSKPTFDAAKKLEAIDQNIFSDMNKAQKAAGQAITKGRKGHYGAGREWNGDQRVVLRDEAGEVAAIAVADSRRAAQARAKFIQEKMAAEGKTVKIAEEFNASVDLDKLPKDVRPLVRTPHFTMERADIRGWHGDFEDRTREELMKVMEKNVRGRMRYQANLATDTLLARDLQKLSIEDPLAARMVEARMRDRAGFQGTFSQWQNNMTDKLLAPIMGKNSASKIVTTTNSAMWHLQLGGLNVGHVVADGMSFIQTVAPEVAFVLSADESRLGKYTWFATGNTKGEVRGGLGVLNPMVLMTDAFKKMGKPNKELQQMFARAANDGIIDPRIVEDYVGESAGKVKDLKAAISSPGGFATWVKSVSEFLPGMVEKGSRAYAFTVGHTIAADHFGITDPDQIYLMAKQFVEHTMYSYSASDRPRMLTGPLGGAFGLFKNWMMNYTGAMLEYTQEGLMHGNWAPLVWQTAGTLATGGLAAMPMAGVADGFSEMFTGKDMLELTHDAFGGKADWAANGLMFGFPAAVTGYSVSGRVASPWVDPIHNSNVLFSFAHWDRMQYLGKAFGHGMDEWFATGRPPSGDPRFWQLLGRATLPGTLYRTMSAAQEGAINSLSSGYPEMKGVNPIEKLFYAMGFTPAELERNRAIANKLYEQQSQRQQMTTALSEAFAEAQLRNDGRTMTHIMQQAYMVGLDPSAVLRAATSRYHKMTTPLLERNFSPQDILRYKSGGS